MKKLLLIAVSIFAFSSCSDMRYAGMNKVKQHTKSTTIVETKTRTEKISPSEIKSIDKIQTEQLVLNETKPNTQIENNKIEKTEKNNVSPKIAKITKKVFPKTANKINKEESKISERKSIEKKQSVNKTQLDKGSWLWYVVVGIVFVLVGSIIAGPVGNVLWIVGVVLVVYGLLTLLEVM